MLMSKVTSFFDAIRQSDHAGVKAMLAADSTLAKATDDRCFGATPLIHAAGVNDRGMIDILLDAGADPSQRTNWWAGGFGPLDDCSADTADHLLSRGAVLTPHAAARLGRIADLKCILDANPAAVHQRGGDGQFPLHYSATQEVAALLLERGAQIDATDLDHEGTAAQWCLPERPGVAAYLVQRGARPDPFMAAAMGDIPLLEKLLANDAESVNAKITRSRFPTSEKAAGHIYLFTIGENCSLIHAAANGNQAGVIRWLAQRSVDVNARGGYDDQTPLHATAWRDCPEAASALLDAGANINARSGPMHHNEPIGWAIVGGSVETVRVLISRGCVMRDVHFDDARRGVAGEWRWLRRHRPLDAWRKIESVLASGGNAAR